MEDKINCVIELVSMSGQNLKDKDDLWEFLKRKGLFMVAAPPNFRGDLKLSDQNNSWGGGEPEQKIKFWGELNLRGDIKF